MFGWFQERKQHLFDNHFYIKQEFANTIMLLKKFARIDLLVLHLINSMFTLTDTSTKVNLQCILRYPEARFVDTMQQEL